MCFYNYVRAENIMKDFYRKLKDYTTSDAMSKTKKILFELDRTDSQTIIVGSDTMTGKVIPVAELYDIHKGSVIRGGVKYKHRQESWICLYSEYNWTGLITATQDVYTSLETKEEVEENLRYEFTTDRDIDGVCSVKH